MTVFTLTQNDTSPPIGGNVTGERGEMIDVTGCDVRFMMKPIGGDTLTVDDDGQVVDGPRGVVGYGWKAADTAEHGTFQAEFELTYPDGTVETFPSESLTVIIKPDLG
ncbi:hypothetical protein [Halorubellus litoreus]|uniref:BppU N-terminal domain-containing protein n=1 Tax=Halorubellus litoreus TaxID=755308 RepID=A0ABD5VE91_9EURY